MKKLRILLAAFVAVAAIAAGIQLSKNPTETQQITASEVPMSEELVTPDMEWKYLDDQTDPNVGTWYEEWNKRNGWAYPLDFLDWGVVPMRFDDALWPETVGNKFSTDPSDGGTTLASNEDGTVGPTYYFRHTFTLENPEDIVAISGKVRYNSAIILYVNGKPVESLFNIPISNYPTNLSYGASEKVENAEGYIEEEFIMEDVSSLREGLNTIAIELHASEPLDTYAYLELMSFVLNPSEDILPETQKVKNVAVNIGEDENSVNFAWYALSNAQGQLQIVPGEDTTAPFPEASATTIDASTPELAYTKFFDKHYYSSKVTFDGIEHGTNYLYRVGNSDGWSETYKLNTTDISQGYEVLFVSDPQIGTGTIPTDRHGWNNTLEQAFSLYPNISFIANTGDMVDVATKEVEYDAYFAPSKLTSYPTATAVGNHDISANYKYHYNEPNLSNYGVNEANSDYYFIYGNTLYLVLNTNNTNNGEHAAFMRETIEATKDMDFDWTVAMFHQSIYSAAKQSTQEINIQRREELVPVIDELGIDIVLMGHDHCYVRSNHMKNFEVQSTTTTRDLNGTEIDPEGTLYLTTSSASGSKYYDIVADYDYSAVQHQFYVPTFSRLTFTEDTFTLTTHRTDTMEVIDTYAMTKTVATNSVDKTTLESLVSQAKAIVTTNYTDTSVQPFTSAIASAESVLANASALQSDVDTATSNLQAAMDGLVLKDTITTESEATASTSVSNPATGDSVSTSLLIFLTLLSGVVMVTKIVKKNRSN